MCVCLFFVSHELQTLVIVDLLLLLVSMYQMIGMSSQCCCSSSPLIILMQLQSLLHGNGVVCSLVVVNIGSTWGRWSVVKLLTWLVMVGTMESGLREYPTTTTVPVLLMVQCSTMRLSSAAIRSTMVVTVLVLLLGREGIDWVFHRLGWHRLLSGCKCLKVGIIGGIMGTFVILLGLVRGYLAQ